MINEVQYSRRKAGGQRMITQIMGNWRTKEGKKGRESRSIEVNQKEKSHCLVNENITNSSMIVDKSKKMSRRKQKHKR